MPIAPQGVLALNDVGVRRRKWGRRRARIISVKREGVLAGCVGIGVAHTIYPSDARPRIHPLGIGHPKIGNDVVSLGSIARTVQRYRDEVPTGETSVASGLYLAVNRFSRPGKQA